MADAVFVRDTLLRAETSIVFAAKFIQQAYNGASANTRSDLLDSLAAIGITEGEIGSLPTGATATELYNGVAAILGAEAVTELEDAATIEWDSDLSLFAKVTLEGNRTLDKPDNLEAGKVLYLVVKQDEVGGRSLTLGEDMSYIGGKPILNDGPNEETLFTLFTADGTNVDVYPHTDGRKYSKIQAYDQEIVLTDAATIVWDMTNSPAAQVTLADNRILSVVNLQVGTCVLKIIQDEVGSRTVTWPANTRWVGGSLPKLSTDADAVDIISFYCDGTNLYGNALLGMAAES